MNGMTAEKARLIFLYRWKYGRSEESLARQWRLALTDVQSVCNRKQYRGATAALAYLVAEGPVGEGSPGRLVHVG